MSLFKGRQRAKNHYQDYLNYKESSDKDQVEEEYDQGLTLDRTSVQPDTLDSDAVYQAENQWNEWEGYEDFLMKDFDTQQGPYPPHDVDSLNLDPDLPTRVQADWWNEEDLLSQTPPSYQRRAKYSAKIDHFLNNGILITGALLILVLLIAFLA